MSQNYTLICCLAKTGQDQHLQLGPQSHSLFYTVFFDKEHSNPSPLQPPRKYPWQELFKSPRHSFIWDPPFSKFETEICPPSRRGREGLTLC